MCGFFLLLSHYTLEAMFLELLKLLLVIIAHKCLLHFCGELVEHHTLV